MHIHNTILISLHVYYQLITSIFLLMIIVVDLIDKTKQSFRSRRGDINIYKIYCLPILNAPRRFTKTLWK